MIKKLKKRKQILFIVIVGAVILVLLAMAAGFIFSSKYAEKISRAFSDLNPFKPEKEAGGDKGEIGTISPLGKVENKTETKTEAGGGGGGASAVAEEVTYGTGKLRIVSHVSDPNIDLRPYNIVHCSNPLCSVALEGYDSYDRIYANVPFSPSGKATKIISRITGYELLNDVRPVDSLSTIYLELSLHSQSGGAITINSTNELRLSMPLTNEGYDFGSKTITLQQYSPNNASAVYTSYNVRDVINNNNGIITLPNLSGTYASQVPYAYFRLGFS